MSILKYQFIEATIIQEKVAKFEQATELVVGIAIHLHDSKTSSTARPIGILAELAKGEITGPAQRKERAAAFCKFIEDAEKRHKFARKESGLINRDEFTAMQRELTSVLKQAAFFLNIPNTYKDRAYLTSLFKEEIFIAKISNAFFRQDTTLAMQLGIPAHFGHGS